MLKYMSYLYANVRKKWSTYLIPVLGMLIFGVILYVTVAEMNKSGVAAIGNPSINSIMNYFYFLPFVFGSMFVGTKALNIFKDGEDDGTELLIVSKPISRWQIVLGKFLTLYSLILVYVLWTFIITLSIGFADKHATSSAVISFAGGFSIGTLIIMILFSAIITFFASILGKIGTMALSIVVPAIVPIISFILVPVGKGNLSEVQSLGERAIYTTSVNGESVYVDDPVYIYDKNDAELARGLKIKEGGFYNTASYFDIWQHMVGFYSLLESQVPSIKDSAVKLVHEQVTLSKDNAIVLHDQQHDYIYTVNGMSDNSATDPVLVDSKMSKLIELVNLATITPHLAPTLEDSLSAVEQELANSQYGQQIHQLLGDNSLSAYAFAGAYWISKNQPTYKFNDLSNNDHPENYRLTALDASGNAKIDVLRIAKYHETSSIVIVYVLLGVALSALVIFRYYRRDFK